MQEMQAMQIPSLCPEDPLEEEMAMHSDILAWGIPWTEEPNGLAVHGTAESQTRLRDQVCNMKWNILMSIIY